MEGAGSSYNIQGKFTSRENDQEQSRIKGEKREEEEEKDITENINAISNVTSRFIDKLKLR